VRVARYADREYACNRPGIQQQVSSLRSTAKAAFESADKVFNRAFTPAWNPLVHLGTLGWFFYWIVIVSDIYLYIFFDTGMRQAYESLEYITNAQWYAGGIMRSLHRYASDALIIVMMLHLTREFVMDRYRGARWFTWFTGVPLTMVGVRLRHQWLLDGMGRTRPVHRHCLN